MSSLVKEFAMADGEFRLAGVVDHDAPASLERLSDAHRAEVKVCESVSEMMRTTKPDAIAIGTRCDSHARIASECAAYGLPIYLEKPVATSLGDAEALEAAFGAGAPPVLVSFPLRASALCRGVRRKIEDGAVGRPHHILGVNYVPYGDVYFRDWYRDYSITQGLLLQKATHDFDYISYLMGSPISRVVASLTRGRVYRDVRSIENGVREPSTYYGEGIGLPEEGCNEDATNVLLEFESGAIGLYTQVFYCKRKAGRRGSRISGWDGTIHFDWSDSLMEVIRHHEPTVETTVYDNTEGHFGGDSALARNFVAMVKDGAPSLAPISAGLRSVYACLAAKQSVEAGKFVDVKRLKEGGVAEPGEPKNLNQGRERRP